MVMIQIQTLNKFDFYKNVLMVHKHDFQFNTFL